MADKKKSRVAIIRRGKLCFLARQGDITTATQKKRSHPGIMHVNLVDTTSGM